MLLRVPLKRDKQVLPSRENYIFLTNKNVALPIINEPPPIVYAQVPVCLRVCNTQKPNIYKKPYKTEISLHITAALAFASSNICAQLCAFPLSIKSESLKVCVVCALKVNWKMFPFSNRFQIWQHLAYICTREVFCKASFVSLGRFGKPESKINIIFQTTWCFKTANDYERMAYELQGRSKLGGFNTRMLTEKKNSLFSVEPKM